MIKTSRDILNSLYGLMMEINFKRPDEDVLDDLHSNPDEDVEKQLSAFKRLKAKYQAEITKEKFNRALRYFEELKSKGSDELNSIISQPNQMKLEALHRKLENLTEKDKGSILEDQELLNLIEYLDNKKDENNQ